MLAALQQFKPWKGVPGLWGSPILISMATLLNDINYNANDFAQLC